MRNELELGRDEGDIKREFLAAGWPDDKAAQFIEEVRAAMRDPKLARDTRNARRDLVFGTFYIAIGVIALVVTVVTGYAKVIGITMPAGGYGAYLVGRVIYRSSR